ncbi:PD40 domain-containing protein [Labrenzia sp. PHM005]|uniref:TolB family protein n=1 Tax=Labrenzia sp. PHM005 TaxID=2590016 RepID=UPI00113FE8BA|nr:PD40 domain-containing protein [Labrenzia sp. PHM005]QDG74607.1 hypothetical protein FJ695_01280 [Labrenzia sp. PHM005]
MLNFDETYYLTNNLDVAATIRAGLVSSALEHFKTSGFREGRDPHALFDVAYYLLQNPDVDAAGVNPLDHFNASGANEGRNPNPHFDTAYYLEQNPDVANAGVNAFEHFIKFGADEGRNPSANFDVTFYRDNNPDVRDAGINPLEHYLGFGLNEGRAPIPDPFDLLELRLSNLTSNGNGTSSSPSVSADGKTVVFGSSATNLIVGQTDNNEQTDIFLFDANTKSLTNLTVGSNGHNTNASVSYNGNAVAFSSIATNLVDGQIDSSSSDIFLYDATTQTTKNLTFGANAGSYNASISGDGNFVVFESDATNLVNGQSDTNGLKDIFIYDVNSQTVQNLTLGANGESIKAVTSQDGMIVVFESDATNLVSGQNDNNLSRDIFLYNANTGKMTNLTHGGYSGSHNASVSSDGKTVVFNSYANTLVTGQADVNGSSDIFVYDVETQTTSNITHGANGNSFFPEVSANGETISFYSYASNIHGAGKGDSWINIILYNISSRSAKNITFDGSDNSYNPSASSDGLIGAFERGSGEYTPSDYKVDIVFWELI